MTDEERTRALAAMEKLVVAFEHYDRTPNAVHLDDLKLAVGAVRRSHHELVASIARSMPHQPDPPAPPAPWYHD